jgi:GDP/UDP-N,N'-diacetylbacillosamine 2-epimerase (hydrolysing)
MKIGILTSSRADFGIYTPLLKELTRDPFFTVDILVFGSHLSAEHGMTVKEIRSYFPGNITELRTQIDGTDERSVAFSYADTVSVFSKYWADTDHDLILCLGDRYEMNAAVQASIPYGIKLGHFHGGEKTLGAFDNIYRHQITLAATYHFTATEEFSACVREKLDDSHKYVFAVGSLSLSDLMDTPLLGKDEFRQRYELPDKDLVLCTFHPETMNSELNPYFSKEMYIALSSLSKEVHLLVSMPNADTHGMLYRSHLEQLKAERPSSVTLVESFGKVNYFSAMKHSLLLLGNSSSGIIEAASFEKYAVNVGDRQKGRVQSGNVIDVAFESDKITDAVNAFLQNPKTFTGENKYVKPDTVSNVIGILKSIGNGAFQ